MKEKMKKNLLIAMAVHEESQEQLRSIPEIGEVALIEPGEEEATLPIELSKDKHVLFTEGIPTNFDDMVSLEFIQLTSAGYSQLFELDLPKRGVRASNARGVLDMTVSEWNLAMMINLARDLRGLIRNQEAGVWDRSEKFQREINGSTVGIWGYGGIGRETARLCKALKMTVHVMVNRPVKPEPNWYCVPCCGDPEGKFPDRVFMKGEEEEFLSNLDFLVITLPLKESTRGIVGAVELSMLPKTAYLLNPARGPIIDEQALLEALRKGKIAGAALDTHYYYPMPADHPLWKFPNVIMTPHISGEAQADNFRIRMWDLFLMNVKRLISGETLLNELSPVHLSGE